MAASGIAVDMDLFSYLSPRSSFRAAVGALAAAERSLVVPPAATESSVCVLAQRLSLAIALFLCAIHCSLADS